jgi:hypothetical protein
MKIKGGKAFRRAAQSARRAPKARGRPRVHPCASVFIRVHMWLICFFFLRGPGTTRTTGGLNQERIIHKPQPSFLRDLRACGLHLFPFVPSVPLW